MILPPYSVPDTKLVRSRIDGSPRFTHLEAVGAEPDYAQPLTKAHPGP